MASPVMMSEEAGEPQKLNRRRIYLHRLVGDDVRAPRAKSSRRTSWRVILRFLVYAFIAIFTITNRSNVYALSEVNIGIREALTQIRFGPGRFQDIDTLGDMMQFLKTALLGQLQFPTNGRVNLSMLGFNRVTPTAGVCPEFAAFTLTLRRVKTTTDYVDTTTSRFRQLYPRAWVANSLPAGSAGGSNVEATDKMTSSVDESIEWVHSARCTDRSCTPSNLKHPGYYDQGGYVAVVTVSGRAAYVHLVNNNAELVTDPSKGICSGIRETAVVSWADFMRAGFFDSQFASLAVEFLTYNANLQTMSDIAITFQGSSAGLIVDKSLRSESITLDIYDSIMRYFEVAYLVFTGCYFFELCYRAYKYHPAFLYDAWSYVNFVSIVMSLTSLALWYMYMPELQTFIQSGDFQDADRMHHCFNYILWYSRCGSLATLTICLRMLKFMGDLNSRVRLLLRTLSHCAVKMGIYISYVSVIFLGFTSFAFIKFAAASPDFVTPFGAFLSCFELFLGDSNSMKRFAGGSFKIPFFVLFMLFFYFVSVQMFNAIINYAYNLVSEQMEPEFEQEKREKKRQEMQRLSAGKDLMQSFRDYMFALVGRQKPEDPAAASKDAAAEKEKQKGQLDAAGDEERAKHEKAKEKRKMPESVCRVILFFLFAVFYMWFLVVNLNIADCSDVKRAIDTAVFGTDISVVTVLGGISTIEWNEVYFMGHVIGWLYGSMPSVLFNTTSASSAAAAVQQGIHPADAVCISNWNCLMSGYGFPVETQAANGGAVLPSQANQSNATVAAAGNTSMQEFLNLVPTAPDWASPRNLSFVRITQRRSKIVPNTGCTSGDNPADMCFTGGSTNTTSGNWSNRAAVMMPNRLPDRPVWPMDGIDPDTEERNLQFRLEYAGRPFCMSLTDGGFRRSGGIVCMLDADYGTFLNQLRLMQDNEFFSLATTALTIDFAVYNGNRNLLTYTTIRFEVAPGGVVRKHIGVQTLALLDFSDFLDTWQNSIIRILPGILYIVLVFKFAYDLNWDLRQEIYRKRLNGNNSWLVSTVEFMTLDVFNLLELISISISLVSFILYIIWLVKEGNLADAMSGDLNGFLDYCADLTSQARLYTRLSAMNCLLIFIRPLKFVRQSVRFAQLYQTLWDARTDIAWFVFMFAITMLGFVMFCYVSFGPFFEGCRTIPTTINYLFSNVLGNFDFWPLHQADPIMSVIFFFPYLLIFSLVFLNIFFAIIDRYYVPKESPPLNLKRRLKPVFQRICRCIEWDEDYVMEADPNMEQKEGPPSRQSKVKDLVQSINSTVGAQGQVYCLKGSKIISEVCDTDERMGDVLHWSREEASKIVMDFHRLLQKKQTVKNDEVFIKTDVMKHVREECKTVREDMEEAERLMRYATKVHEQMALRDQETLAKYILILELKIRNRMKQRHELDREVKHLGHEADSMRYTPEELTQHQSAVQMRQNDRWAADDEDKDLGSDESDEEPVPNTDAAGGEAGNGGADGAGAEDPRTTRRQEKTDALLSILRD